MFMNISVATLDMSVIHHVKICARIHDMTYDTYVSPFVIKR